MSVKNCCTLQPLISGYNDVSDVKGIKTLWNELIRLRLNTPSGYISKLVNKTKVIVIKYILIALS